MIERVLMVISLATGSAGISVGDFVTLAPIVGGVLAAAFLFVKAGPAWNTSLLKQARDRAADLAADLEAAEDRTRSAEVRATQAERRAEKYLLQLIRAGIAPYDEEKP